MAQQNAWQAALTAPFPAKKASANQKAGSQKQPSASERLQQLQNEVNELKRKEAELRSLLSEVAGSAAESFLARVGSLAPEDLPSRDIYDLVQELGFVQRTKSFAQCLQELQGVLKHLERQLRAVERAAIAGHLDTFLIAVSEAVASHNTVAEHCEKLAQLPVSGLPQLLRQHADSAVSRATADQEKLSSSLREVLRKQLSVLGWPPSLASPAGSSPSQAPGSHLVETAGNWQSFEAADQEAVDWLVRLMAALVALQRSVQRSSFELGLDSKAEEPAVLWAVEELTAPLAERLRHHFIGNPNTDRIDHPEWLFETVKRLASRLAPQLTTLTQCLAAHELHASYHLPFEFVRALRAALQGILKQHTLPRLLAAGQPGLWLSFVEKAVAFERQLAPLWGISLLRAAGDEAPELWRRGSCIALICSTKSFRDAWWAAARDEGSRQLDDTLALPGAWSPAHLAWEAAEPVDWNEPSSLSIGQSSEAWQSEFWAPQATDAALSLVTELAKVAAWLPDDAVPDFARAVPQDVLRQLRKHMSSEMKRLEDFREELSAEGAPQAGAMLCGSHHLEHSLREASGHLLLLETPEDEAGVAETSMLSLEADAFGAFKQRGALRLSKVVIDSFRQAAGPYFKKSNIQSFAVTYTPDYREGVLSPGLRKGIDDLHVNLGRLSQVLDAVLFKDMWKGVAAALNRLVFNALVTEAQFSAQGAQQLTTDVSAILDVFLRFTNKPGTHFREVTEAARVLSADEATASEAAWQLRSGPPDQMAAALQPLGIARLTPQQAAHVLAQRL